MPRGLWLVWLVLVAQVAFAGVKTPPEAGLQHEAELRLSLDKPGVAIVAPAVKPYQVAAGEMAEALEASVGRKPRIVEDTISPAELGEGPVILLGNLMDSRIVRSLYLQAYDFTDAAWPSPGGWVVRTIRNPFGTGAHVVLVGGSDVEGVARAAGELITTVKSGGPTLGYVNRVELGRWADQIEGYSEHLLGDDEATWHRSGVSGSWDYMIQIARAGLGYLRTGDDAYLPVFKRELRWWFDHDVYHPKGDAPQMLHGFLNTLIIVWDLVRDHPFFGPEERRKFDEDFLHVFRSAEGPGRIDGASRRTVVRDNHGTRTALDAFFGGRFFSKRYGLDEAERWLAIADRYFASQMTSAKPVCDSWGHQWSASLYNTLTYAMAAGKHGYFHSPALKLAADRALIAHPNGEGPLGYLSACAIATGDTGYLSAWQEPDLARRGAQMHGHGDEYMRSFSSGGAVTSRDDLLGVAVAPVDTLWSETIDAAGFNPGGLFLSDVPRESRFDKVAIREGWAPGDYYLLFDGISGGHHSYQNANCIVRFCEAGRSWLAAPHSASESATVRSQNGVFVCLDGAGPGRLHRYARLLYAGRSGPYFALAGALEGIGPVDWERHILRKQSGWTLVVDRVAAATPGEILAERHWYVEGEVTPRPDGLVSRQGPAHEPQCLHLESEGLLPEGMTGTNDRTEIVRAVAAPDRPFALGTLLHVNRSLSKPDFTLTKTEVGWRIEGADTAEVVMLGRGEREGVTVLSEEGTTIIGSPPPPATSLAAALEAQPVGPEETLPMYPAVAPVTLPWQSFAVGQAPVTAVAVGEDGRLAAGNATGIAVHLAPDGKRLAEAKLESPILSLHFVGDDLLVGDDRGSLARLAPDGTERWRVDMPYRPMAWPYWSEERSRVREITSADINHDGSQEILIANADRRVYAFTGEGSKLWEASVEWGVYTAMTAGRFGNQFALYGGASKPAMHGWCILFGAAGKLLGHFSRPDLVSWSIPCQFRDMRLADVDSDGALEVVNAIDTNCRQLVVYEPDGGIRWDADVAGAALAIAVRPSDQAATVYCSSASGYVSAFDGDSGTRRWTCFLGEPAAFVAIWERDSVLAVTASGRVFVIDAEGHLAGCDDLGTEVTAVLRPGDHRNSSSILVGTAEGRLLVLRLTGPT